MNKFHALGVCLVVALACLMIGCATYTYDDAKYKIEPVPSVPEQLPVPTRMSEISAIQAARQAIIDAEKATKEAEAAAKAAEEAQRLAQRQMEQEQQAKASAEAEAKRLAAEAEAKRIAQAAAAEAEAKRKAVEEAARIAAEAAAKLVAPVPDADSLTFPYQYRPLKEDKQLTGAIAKFSSLLIPLPDNRLSTDDAQRLAQEIASSIADIDLPVVFITGDMQNIVTLVNQLKRDAVIVPEGAIVTSFPVASIGKNSVTVTPAKGKTLQLMLDYAPEYNVLPAFLSDPTSNTWKDVVAKQKDDRVTDLKDALSEASATAPVLIGASLFEPSYQDWTSFAPVTYRSAYDWPLSQLLDDEHYIDGYRATHYSEETDAGVTIRWKNGDVELQERIDYLYSKRLLPMESTMLNLGGLSAPTDKQTPSRYALLCTYILP